MTAVQWLLEELKQLDKKVRSYNTIDYIKKRQSIVKQANEMFEQQIIDAYDRGYDIGAYGDVCEPEKYFNETFKNV